MPTDYRTFWLKRKQWRNPTKNQRAETTARKPEISTTTILKIKIAQSNEHKIKASFTDDTIQEEVKELIYTYVDDQPKELHLQLESRLEATQPNWRSSLGRMHWRDLGQQRRDNSKPWKQNQYCNETKEILFGEDAIDDQKDVRRMVSWHMKVTSTKRQSRYCTRSKISCPLIHSMWVNCTAKN